MRHQKLSLLLILIASVLVLAACQIVVTPLEGSIHVVKAGGGAIVTEEKAEPSTTEATETGPEVGQPPEGMVVTPVCVAEAARLSALPMCVQRCNEGAAREGHDSQACLAECYGENDVAAVVLDQCVSKEVDANPTAMLSLGSFGFTCDFGQPKCSCSGFFDCKILEKSGCCKDPVNSCGTVGGKEVCNCKKSSQCSFSLE